MSAFDSRRRDPHPVPDLAVAMENQRRICVPRGYCGPFINESYYAAFPDPIWHGMADCCVCGNSCRVETEEEKRNAAMAAAGVGREAAVGTEPVSERVEGEWSEVGREAAPVQVRAAGAAG